MWPAGGLARRGRACQRAAGRYPLGQPTLDLRSAGGSINIIKNKICSCQVVEILGRFFSVGAWAGGVSFSLRQEELIHLCQILSPPYLRNVLLRDITRACMHPVKDSQGSGAFYDDDDD